MSKLFIQNLGLIITEKCNLKCRHCMRGKSTNKDMSEEIIEKTLGQIDSIGNITICGGEPTLAMPTFEKILTYVVDNNIDLGSVSTTINGTIYSEELIRLLDYIDNYLKPRKKRPTSVIGISRDVFHIEEIVRSGQRENFIANLKKYVENPHFLSYREITRKLFREGRAEELDERITVPLRPWPIIYTHLKNPDVLEVGPLVTVNVDGIVTECDASIEHQRTLYNYGNILEEPLIDICKRVGTEVTPHKWYRETGKIMRKYERYNK